MTVLWSEIGIKSSTVMAGERVLSSHPATTPARTSRRAGLSWRRLTAVIRSHRAGIAERRGTSRHRHADDDQAPAKRVSLTSRSLICSAAAATWQKMRGRPPPPRGSTTAPDRRLLQNVCAHCALDRPESRSHRQCATSGVDAAPYRDSLTHIWSWRALASCQCTHMGANSASSLSR